MDNCVKEIISFYSEYHTKHRTSHPTKKRSLRQIAGIFNVKKAEDIVTAMLKCFCSAYDKLRKCHVSHVEHVFFFFFDKVAMETD
jgi:hypothetical protein